MTSALGGVRRLRGSGTCSPSDHAKRRNSSPARARGSASATAERAFAAAAATRRARAAWERAGLEPIGLHECRHTYAAHMIAAGVNAKALSAYIGHSSITITLDHRAKTPRTSSSD